jgi:hypothetical protein
MTPSTFVSQFIDRFLAHDYIPPAQRQEMESKAKEYADAIRGEVWSCPDCAFTFLREHEDWAGGHSCPSCGERKAERERDEARDEIARKDAALRQIRDVQCGPDRPSAAGMLELCIGWAEAALAPVPGDDVEKKEEA